MNNLISNLIVKIKRKIYVFYIRNIRKFIRLTSYPYISGDTFRRFADFKLDEISSFSINKVAEGNVIFIKTDFLSNFLEENFLFKNNLKIITHNSDLPVNESVLDFTKNLFFFSQNVSFEIKNDSKIRQIPIGLENRSYLKNGRLSDFKQKINLENKSTNILCSFNFDTNKSRIDVFNTVKDHDLTVFCRYRDHKNFINELSKFQFCFCPEGNGYDTHRFWESLMVGTMPIVKQSNFINNFFEHNIPMLVLKNWEDIYDFDSKALDSIYNQNIETLKESYYLNAEYWFNYIDSF